MTSPLRNRRDYGEAESLSCLLQEEYDKAVKSSDEGYMAEVVKAIKSYRKISAIKAKVAHAERELLSLVGGDIKMASKDVDMVIARELLNIAEELIKKDN